MDIDLAALRSDLETQGIDPATIVVIIQAVITLIKLWRDRSNKVGAPGDFDIVQFLITLLRDRELLDAVIALIEAFRA